MRLVGTQSRVIIAEAKRILSDPSASRAMIDPEFAAYGNGDAAAKILSALNGKKPSAGFPGLILSKAELANSALQNKPHLSLP